MAEEIILPNLEASIDEDKVIQEINDKANSFSSRMSTFLNDFNEYANAYRVMDSRLTSANSERLNSNGLSNTVVPATTRAVETLATMQYAMMTSQNPNFDPVAILPDTDEFSLQAISSLLSSQMEMVEFNRYLLKALRTLNLQGTVFVETPYESWPSGTTSPVWEATSFIPRSLNQVGFAPNCLDISKADWIFTLDFISPYALRKMASMDLTGDTWRLAAIKEAINMTSNPDLMPQEIRTRLTTAGYSGDLSKSMELMVYRGPLEATDSDDDYVVGLANRTKVIRLHKNPFASGLRPILSAHYIEFELEPYGYGIGRLGRKIQSDLNANRNRIQNIITFSLFHMWKMSRHAGIKSGQLKIRPWHIVELDDMNGLEPLRPDASSLTHGLKYEEILREDFETLTGATKNLQAQVTEATATEARITQAEAVRRISVMTEIVADRLIRNYLKFAHKANLQFLDREIWLKLSGSEKPTRVFPDQIRKEVDFRLKLTTDRDFRPKRVQEMVNFLQIATSMRNFWPQNLDPSPIILEIARAMGIDPRKLQKLESPANPQDAARRALQMQALSGLLNKETQLSTNGLPGNQSIGQNGTGILG